MKEHKPTRAEKYPELDALWTEGLSLSQQEELREALYPSLDAIETTPAPTPLKHRLLNQCLESKKEGKLSFLHPRYLAPAAVAVVLLSFVPFLRQEQLPPSTPPNGSDEALLVDAIFGTTANDTFAINLFDDYDIFTEDDV